MAVPSGPWWTQAELHTFIHVLVYSLFKRYFFFNIDSNMKYAEFKTCWKQIHTDWWRATNLQRSVELYPPSKTSVWILKMCSYVSKWSFNFDWLSFFSFLKVLTVAAATCSVPFTVILTNTTVPTTTGVQLLPAYARRTPSWWPRKFRSYEDWVQNKSLLTLWIWTMATWMKTPDIMASFVHGSLRWAGGWWGRSNCPDASLTSISLSLH